MEINILFQFVLSKVEKNDIVTKIEHLEKNTTILRYSFKIM
jgi:hypothetical protein